MKRLLGLILGNARNVPTKRINQKIFLFSGNPKGLEDP